jgi:hypothetical protein
MSWLTRRRERLRAERLYLQALEAARDAAITLCLDIERTAASFGADRLFDDRLRKIEGNALRARKQLDYARNADGSYMTPEQSDAGWAVQ